MPRFLLRTAARMAENGRDYLLTKDLSAPEVTTATPPDPHGMLRTLLESSVRQSTPEATAALAESLIRGLVPDEARMLVALHRIGWSAAVDVDHRDTADSLRHATMLGRESGIVLTGCASLYLTRLIASGLVQESEERPDRGGDYEILLADAPVMAALQASRGVTHRPRVRRYGVELSPLGRTILDASSAAPR